MNEVNYALIDLNWLKNIEESYEAQFKESIEKQQYDQHVIMCAKINLLKEIRRNLIEFKGV